MFDIYSKEDFIKILLNTPENDETISKLNILTIMSLPGLGSEHFFTQEEVNQLILKPGYTTDDFFNFISSIKIKNDETESAYVDLSRKIMFGNNLQHKRIDNLKENIYLSAYNLLGTQFTLYQEMFPQITYSEMNNFFSTRIITHNHIINDLVNKITFDFLNNKEYSNFIVNLFKEENVNKLINPFITEYIAKTTKNSSVNDDVKKIIWIAAHCDKDNVEHYYQSITNKTKIDDKRKADIEKIMLDYIVNKEDSKITIKNRL